jgi:hypothetical protein
LNAIQALVVANFNFLAVDDDCWHVGSWLGVSGEK